MELYGSCRCVDIDQTEHRYPPWKLRADLTAVFTAKQQKQDVGGHTDYAGLPLTASLDETRLAAKYC